MKEELECVGGTSGLAKKLQSDRTLEKTSSIFNALSDPKRLKILEIVTVRPVCVCVIKEMLGIPDSKLSYHLNVMKDAGLIRSKHDRKYLFYYPTRLGNSICEMLKRGFAKK